MTAMLRRHTTAELLRRLAAVALLAALLALLAPSGRAHACSCMMIDADSRLQETEAAFVGSLKGTAGPAEQTRFTFDVEAVLAGELGPTVTVVGPEGDGANCGLSFQPGDRVGLFLYGTPNGWSSSSCDAIDADQLLAAGDPYAPDPSLAADDPETDASAGGAAPWVAVGATAAVAVAALGGVVVLGRRRRV